MFLFTRSLFVYTNVYDFRTALEANTLSPSEFAVNIDMDKRKRSRENDVADTTEDEDYDSSNFGGDMSDSEIERWKEVFEQSSSDGACYFTLSLEVVSL